MAEQIPFKRKLQESGNSISINLPSEIVQHYKWELGDEVCVITDTNKKGQRYVAIYKE